ncbi:hypothetical protein BKA70DRAFT_1440872 [Coprinopsis sp. MPI-PUGE-AT-0042]|nr:hypothetical protein BKA70DRAFT_1440872 [Coprinopsis sp. MPI-PUGE-AT-0042]
MKGTDLILLVIAFFFPPATVAMMTGCSPDFVINLVLTFLGFLPGLLHALFLLYLKVRAQEQWIGGRSYQPYGSGGPSYSTKDYLERGPGTNGGKI